MADLLRNDQRILRTFILYEALERKPVFDAYKHFCKVMGEDVMEYREFECWFYQFYHGNYDLDCEIGSNPKSLLFSELPPDALKIVVEKLDLKGQLTLRKVSHDFRFLVDNQLTFKIRFLFRKDHIFAQINGIDIVYTKYGCVDQVYRKPVKFITSKEYMKTALNDIAFALKNPKVQLESLELGAPKGFLIGEVEKFCGHMRTLLKSLDHQISVKSFTIFTDKPKVVLQMLPFMKPQVLETICIIKYSDNNGSGCEFIDKIVKLDQWKQAKEIHTSQWFPISIQHFLHFTTFRVEVESISSEDVLLLKNALSNSRNFKDCYLSCEKAVNVSSIEKALGKCIFKYKEDKYKKNIRSYPIPDSNEFLDFDISKSGISIDKKQ